MKSKTARSPAPARSPRPRSASGGLRWRRWLLITLAVLVLGPILQVTLLRFFNPRFTPLMALRWVEGRFSNEYEGGIDQRWLTRRQLPDEFLRAVWVSEDARFFQHQGFDWVEVAAAMARARKTGQPVRGSSTITQQCARSTFLWTGRSYVRKGLEAYYTWWMERLLDKQRILEVYANVVEMGDGIYGVEAAARRHFRVGAAQLTRSQAAMLAALLPYPRGWDPNEPSPRLRWRHRRVLRELAKVGNQPRELRGG
ncbi:MAG: monofunctional biosynthetic peptidoglycan transglycosylase [Verrucomicrobia bacterium]|nr:monofunctional biosynthetic peptidoglycan transglycosylase [Verrucomicrobiota bacterium]